MIRKDIFKEIGKLKPSVSIRNPDEVNFSSIFIIPLPHNIHKIKKIKKFFLNLQVNWDIKNNTIEKDLSLYDIKQYIKNNVFENIDLNNDGKKIHFIYDKKNLYLSHKNKNIYLKFAEINIILKEIDLWIMDGNIAFFTYKIELDKDNIYDINTISTKINRSLRDYKELRIDVDSKEIYYRDKKGISLLEYFMSLTIGDDKKSFLNIEYIKDKFVTDSDLSVIVESTFYAKTISALHIEENSVKVNNEIHEICPIIEELVESAAVNIGILEELSYLLGTTSSYDFDKELGFVAHAGYVYPIIKYNGINIWKFWSGIALQDSLTFFSIDKGGTGIVNAAKTSGYFIYMINQYVSIRLKYIENYLIDKDFINIDRVLPSVKEIQVLKNHYIANEISLKFQPNHINEKINIGMKTHELLAEVEDNLEKTLELTRYNTDIVFSLGAGLVTIGSMLLSIDDIANLYKEYPYITFIGSITIVIIVTKAANNKAYFIKKIKNTYKIIYRFLGLQ